MPTRVYDGFERDIEEVKAGKLIPLNKDTLQRIAEAAEADEAEEAKK